MYTREQMIKEMSLLMGGQMVDVELDPEHYDLAIDMALEYIRKYGGSGVAERFLHFRFQEEVQEYTLPDEVQIVRDIYRRGTGLTPNTGVAIEPFEAQYMNSYLMQTGAIGGLAVYDALAQHRKILARMFGGYLQFTFNTVTKSLLVHRKLRADEDVFLRVYVERPEEELLNDRWAKSWLRSYATAKAKLMLSEAYSKFAQITGPQGGTTLKGDKLATEAMQEIEKLEISLRNYGDGSIPHSFIIG